jgi:ATP-dependent RNA helicase SUPV3L1/SUV3
MPEPALPDVPAVESVDASAAPTEGEHVSPALAVHEGIAAEPIAEAAVTPDAALSGESVPSAEAAAAAPGEPELVEVWRPGGRSEERRGPRRPPRRPHARAGRGAAQCVPQGRPQEGIPVAAQGAEGAVAVDGSAEAAAAPAEQPAEQHRRRRRGPPGEFRRDRQGGEREGEGGEQRQGPRSEHRRPQHRSERHGDAQDRPRGDRPERSRDRPHFAKDRNEQKDRRDYAPRREREKQPDPDSPFAKLAALKAQLEANAKERR